MKRLGDVVKGSGGGGVVTWLVCLSLIALFCGPARSEELFPELGGVRVQQAGSSLAVLEFKGAHLPRPEVRRVAGDRVELFWSRVTLPSGTWERTYKYPLVERIELNQEAGGLLCTVITGAALRVKEIRGTAPARKMRVYLTKGGPRPSPTPQPKRTDLFTPRTASPVDPLQIDKPVTLELRDTPLRQAFFMLGRIMGRNIVCDPSLPDETVTVSLREVPLKEAFSYLMRMYDVRYGMMGKTIVVGTSEQLAHTLGRETTRVFHLAYADPEQIVSMLQGLVPVEKVVVDARRNELYVTASPEMLARVQKALERLDNPGRQVMLEARIIEVNDDASKEMESMISHVYKQWYFWYGSGGGVMGYVDTNRPDLYTPEGDRDDGTINPPPGVDTPEMTGNALYELDAGLRALEEESKADVLARPSVVAVDGQTARVELTQNYLYVSGYDDNNNPEIAKEEAGPTLSFTPRVGRNGVITLEIDIATGQILEFRKSGNAETPVTSSRSVQTTVRVRDGEPFVVGGLFNDIKNRSVSKIPIVGDIPLLGELFTMRSKSHIRNEVVMVVVPYILEVPEEPLQGEELLSQF
ncbi:MAG: secretion protein [Synergistales bacterium]|nr:secretion protein [Synergistales bacterium]